MKNLIKDGKLYNTNTSTLIAKSSWFTHYKTQRRVIYRTSKGNYFEVTEIAETFSSESGHLYVRLNDGSESTLGQITNFGSSIGSTNDDVKIKEVLMSDTLTEKKVMDKYEYTMNVGVYLMSTYAKAKYTFFKNYSELFKIEEA